MNTWPLANILIRQLRVGEDGNGVKDDEEVEPEARLQLIRYEVKGWMS